MLLFSRSTRVDFRRVKCLDRRRLSENLTYEHLTQHQGMDISEILPFQKFPAIWCVLVVTNKCVDKQCLLNSVG